MRFCYKHHRKMTTKDVFGLGEWAIESAKEHSWLKTPNGFEVSFAIPPGSRSVFRSKSSPINAREL
jgi:hypothetical protein